MADKDALKCQLFDMIVLMENEGLVSDRLKLAYSYKKVNGPFFFTELISTFISNTQNSLRGMIAATEKPEPDYSILEGHCMKVKGGCSSIGAVRMFEVCTELHGAICDKSKDGCIAAVETLRNEFLALHAKIDPLLQVENKIISRGKP